MRQPSPRRSMPSTTTPKSCTSLPTTMHLAISSPTLYGGSGSSAIRASSRAQPPHVEPQRSLLHHNELHRSRLPPTGLQRRQLLRRNRPRVVPDPPDDLGATDGLVDPQVIKRMPLTDEDLQLTE